MEKPVYGGDCLTRLAPGVENGNAGKALFVPLTLPGETISAHIVETKRSFAKAELDAVLTPSPDRVPPPCRHYGTCGGCHYQHAIYSTQMALKEQILRETLTRAGVDFPTQIPTLSANPWEYRNRIRLAVTPTGELGYRSRRSHAVVPITECPIAAPSLLRTAWQVVPFLPKSSSPITELEIFTNHDESQFLLTLFCESIPKSDPLPWLESLHRSMKLDSIGIRLQISDAAIQPQILAACGPSSLTYKVADFEYQVPHGAFFQVNRHFIHDFTTRIIAKHSGKSAWDLYAGVGLFARQLAVSFSQVLAVEFSPASYPALQQNLDGVSGCDARPIASSTLDFLRRNRENREPGPNLILLDPPRSGLGEEVTTLLNAIHAPQMIYVSCDPSTLARDLHALTQERFHVESVVLADMFPQTFHIETIVNLRRR